MMGWILYALFMASIIVWGPWMILIFPACYLLSGAIEGAVHGLMDAYEYHRTRKEES